MTTWYRHEGDSRWHTGAEAGASFVTLCNGRWPVSEVDEVEQHDSPPHEDRCQACQRGAIEIRRVERGLTELAQAAPDPDWPGLHELFDLGGES